MTIYLSVILLLILGALLIGVAGYHWLAGLSWVDSLLNASMILGGMGPVDVLPNPASKIFASAFALFSGVFFIAIMGILFVPILHRVLHKFHAEDKDFQK
jgi:hypothetical protein